MTLPEGESADSPEVKADLARVDKVLQRTLPGARIASYPSTGDDAFVSDDGRTVFALAYAPPEEDDPFGGGDETAARVSQELEGMTVAGEPVQSRGSGRSRTTAGTRPTAQASCSRP